jgi:hypothetical protein
MKKSLLLWILAFVITVFTAAYQRLTGPTYPISGNFNLEELSIKYKFFRSHGGESDHKVNLITENSELEAYLYYKRYKTNDEWTKVPMERHRDTLYSFLPYQPPAGKLEYYLELKSNNQSKLLPEEEAIVIRFKGDVPLSILIPHIIFMFLSMMLSNRTGLEFFNKGKNLKRLTHWTLITLIIGGFIFGPLTQLYAFGELWTGFPFGYDLTDNKTLIALIGWIIAILMYKRSAMPTKWALFASILLLIVYLIPHSLLGSELDYNKLDSEKMKIEKIDQLK